MRGSQPEGGGFNTQGEQAFLCGDCLGPLVVGGSHLQQPPSSLEISSCEFWYNHKIRQILHLLQHVLQKKFRFDVFLLNSCICGDQAVMNTGCPHNYFLYLDLCSPGSMSRHPNASKPGRLYLGRRPRYINS